MDKCAIVALMAAMLEAGDRAKGRVQGDTISYVERADALFAVAYARRAAELAWHPAETSDAPPRQT